MKAPSSVEYLQRREPAQSTRFTHKPAPKADVSTGAPTNSKEIGTPRTNDDTRAFEPQDSGEAVQYRFGDAGSSWRMTKLKAVYNQAQDRKIDVETVAFERYGSLRDFDYAREEEIELDRRKRYGRGYVGKDRPSGDLYRQRLKANEVQRSVEPHRSRVDRLKLPQAEPIAPAQSLPSVGPVDSSTLNKMKAVMLKAKMRKMPEADKLEAEYNAALQASQQQPADVILGERESRMLAGGSRNEAKPATNRRAADRGQLEANDDMTIEDMVREERRNKGPSGNEGARFAEIIAKDGRFETGLDYMDENASKLARRIQKSEINLKNVAVSDLQRVTKVLDNCQLCYQEDSGRPPDAPVISLATRVFLTLPTSPEISDGGAVIVPVQHRVNLLECDDDEWEEIRNFMKSLTRLYHDQGRDVIFYENAAQPRRHRHAALQVVPLPYSMGETAPAFFREAIMTADEEWSQHRKLIDTLARARKDGLGRLAFRKSIAKEMPYFHVWFELDGGLGHIIEDERRWPRGDLFAREVIGGILDAAPDVIRKQGRWHREDDRVAPFEKKWRNFDWTRLLSEGQ